MRFFSTLLPLALSLVSFSQATILEDHGYILHTKGNFDAVFGPQRNGVYQLVNGLAFYPSERAVVFRVAKNELDPERENKLDLSQIYNALAERRDCKPQDLDWVISEVYTQGPTVELIDEIRKDRELGPMEGVTVEPGQKGWNEILGTKHFQPAAIIKSSPPDIIFIRTVQRTLFRVTYDVHALFFHFSTPETDTQKDETSTSTIDEQTENSGANRNEEWSETWEAEEELVAILRAFVADTEE